MNNIDCIKKAIDLWQKYTKDCPKFVPWINGDLLFLLDIAGRTEGIGPLAGVGVRDVGDRDVGGQLCEVQRIARKMCKKLEK